MSAGATVHTETLARELAAEVEFWRGRALQLSNAVTVLSERLADLEAAQAVGELELVNDD